MRLDEIHDIDDCSQIAVAAMIDRLRRSRSMIVRAHDLVGAEAAALEEVLRHVSPGGG